MRRIVTDQDLFESHAAYELRVSIERQDALIETLHRALQDSGVCAEVPDDALMVLADAAYNFFKENRNTRG